MTAPPSTVLVPLYMYPLTPETWEPLHAAIRSHPQLQFAIVLNPNSGPGSPPWWPDPNYVREIPLLNGYENVRTLGYVRIDYCKRPLSDVIDDIRTYGSWAEDHVHAGTFVQGIFFDETPNGYSANAASYLQRAGLEARTAMGIAEPRIVLHNPGTPPDQELDLVSMPDITAVSEESLMKYRGYDAKKALAKAGWDRSRCCIVLHTVPKERIRDLVRELRHLASYVFVTELGPGAYYQKWGREWEKFVDAMASSDP